jgi:surface polysaccharide O-acyltransferase-like enzyme
MTKSTAELINYLRFPMIVGIVFIHTHFFKWLAPEEMIGGPECAFPILYFSTYAISGMICQAFVLIFFLFSGYLFFKEGELTPRLYGVKLRRRCFSLLVPYIIWNSLAIGVMAVQERYLGGASERMGAIVDYQWKDWLYVFYDTSQSWSVTGPIGQPANISLWFIRDLMILVILSPLFYAIAKISKHLGLIILIAIYLIPYHLPHLNNSACFYFGLGALMAVRNVDIAPFASKYLWIFAFLTLVLLGLYIGWENSYVLSIFRLSEVFFILGLTVKILNMTTFRLPDIMNKSTFFIYASHVIPTAALCYFVCRFLPHTEWVFMSCYLIIPIVVSFGLTAVYIVLQHLFPRFTSILTGGR